MRKPSVSLTVLALSTAIVLPALAAVPPVITYQGRLTQTDGTPYTGNKPVNYAVYDGADERGKYAHPEAWGRNVTQGVGYHANDAGRDASLQVESPDDSFDNEANKSEQ